MASIHHVREKAVTAVQAYLIRGPETLETITSDLHFYKPADIALAVDMIAYKTKKGKWKIQEFNRVNAL